MSPVCSWLRLETSRLKIATFCVFRYVRQPSFSPHLPPAPFSAPHETWPQTDDIGVNLPASARHRYPVRVILTKAKYISVFISHYLPPFRETFRIAWTCHMGFRVSCLKGALLCLFLLCILVRCFLVLSVILWLSTHIRITRAKYSLPSCLWSVISSLQRYVM